MMDDVGIVGRANDMWGVRILIAPAAAVAAAAE
jgi:hypothetical protein